MTFPDNFHIDLDEKFITFLVPKFHLPSHVDDCQTAFSFNLTPGVGRTDGEVPKSGWSDINPLSSQTKQMGPASRPEAIDDHFGELDPPLRGQQCDAKQVRMLSSSSPSSSRLFWIG